MMRTLTLSGGPGSVSSTISASYRLSRLSVT